MVVGDQKSVCSNIPEQMPSNEARRPKNAMKQTTVMAAISSDEREVAATFKLSTGRLTVSSNGKILEDIRPPDSWLVLASANHQCEWGTRPTATDLLAFLDQYATAPSAP